MACTADTRQYSASRIAHGTHFVKELSLAGSSKHCEELEEDGDNGRLAQERWEARDELVEVAQRYDANRGVLIATGKENLADLTVDRVVDGVGRDELGEVRDKRSVDLERHV